jgi:hypothetical protein
VTYSQTDAQQAAHRGAAWLDEEKPEWFGLGEPDFTSGAMREWDQCAYGRFVGLAVRVRVPDRQGGYPEEGFAEAHGFQTPFSQISDPDERDAEYDLWYGWLADAWNEEIRQRREAAMRCSEGAPGEEG